MKLLVFLTDRTPEEALPALAELRRDLKHEPLSVTALEHVASIEPEAVLVDAVENPGQAWIGPAASSPLDLRIPVVVVVERDQPRAVPRGTRRPTRSSIRGRRRRSSGSGWRSSDAAPAPGTASWCASARSRSTPTPTG